MKVRIERDTVKATRMFFKSTIEMIEKWSITEETLKRATLRFVEAGNQPTDAIP